MKPAFDRLLIAGTAVLIALLGANIALTFHNTRQLRHDAARVEHTHEVLSSLERLLSLMKDAETAQRGFIITGEDSYQEPYQTTRAAIDQQVDHLAELTGDDPVQGARIPQAREHIAARLRVIDESLSQRRDLGFEAARQVVMSGLGAQEMEALRSLVAEMMHHEHGLLKTRDQTSHRTYHMAQISGLVSGMAALVALGTLILITRRHISARANAEHIIAEQAERLRTTLASIGDAVIATDTEGRVTNLNPAAESMTGWANSDAVGQPLEVVFTIVNETTRQTAESPVTKALREGIVVGLANHTILIAKDGSERAIDDSAAPIRCKEGEIVGCVLVFRDVSEHRVAERALVISNARKGAILTSALDCIISMDHEGRIVDFNPAAERTFGYERTAAMGKTVAEAIIPPEYRAAHERGLAHFMATGEGPVLGRRVELTAQRADGSQFPCELAITTTRLEDQPPFFTAYLRDITERVRSQEALQESEERYVSLISLVTDVPWTTDATGEFATPQPAWTHFTGQTWEQHRGFGWIEAIHPEDRDDVRRLWYTALACGSPYESHCRLWHEPTKQWRRITTHGAPLRNENGNIREWVGSCTDIEDEAKARDALHQNEALFSDIIDQAPGGVYVIDDQFQMMQVNALARPTFASVEPVIGRDFAEIMNVLWGPEVGAGITAIFHHTLETGERYIAPRFTNDRYDLKTVKTYDWEVQRLTLPNGKHGVVCYFSDVTEQRTLEEALRTQAEQLAQADRSKDEFLAMLAHELRNPLAPLRNATELLQAPELDAAEREQAQLIIARQIENMSRMIDDLLDVSRITEGKIELRKQPVALETILTAAASLARSSCAAHHQELSVSIPAEPMYLEADATRLEQVFGNLLNNACKYSGDGCHISLSAQRMPTEPPEVLVSVRDDGAGIDPELLPRIFDLFVQATRALDREHGGLGIGLTLVKRLVGLHGGSVEAHSEGLGHGSEFIVHLPVMKSAPPPAPPSAPVPREVSHRMLIVDDNTDSAASLAALQARRGHQTRTAFNGPDALLAAAEFKPQVVLLDIGLPGMDGFEVARRLRTIPAMSHAFLIAMSGYGSADDRATAKEAGFDEYLVKPVDLATLRDWLRQRVPAADTAS